jgi:hypothetical protein
MATLTDVARIAMGMPEVEEGTSYGNRAWKVKGRTFVWERPLRPRDEEELGDRAPDGDVIGVRVEDEMAKEILCDNEGPAVFTVDHFAGFDAVLIDLEEIGTGLLEDLIEDAWRVMAPARLRAYPPEGT